MSGEFRQATEGDAETILRVMSGAFARAPGSEKYVRDRERLAKEIDTHWVLVREGEVVGAVHITRDEIQVGRSIIAKADVGEVCIAPEHHGEGLGTALMQMTVDQLRSDGYPLSRLGGYRRFYERFGWVPFPRGWIDFALSGLTSRGGYTDPVTYLDRSEEDVHIRPYDGTRDAVVCQDLYALFNVGRTGARPTRSFGSISGDPWRVVYEVDGIVRAYVSASQNDLPYTKLSPEVSISDGACDPGDTRPLGETLRYVLRQAAIAGAESVRARLPLDPSLYDLYRDSSCGFVPSLWQSSEGGNMLQILSLKGLLEAISPELAERFRAAEQSPGEVGLRVNEEAVGLSWDGDRITVGEAEGSCVNLGQDGMMKMVLGLVPVEQLVNGKREETTMLREAFPVQRTATGVWG
jgi:predicted N-acetyltransferase YhbS